MTTQTWPTFRQIAIHSLDVAIYAWPITLALTLLCISALLIGSPLRSASLRRKIGVLFISYLIPVVIIIIGTVLRYDGPPHPHWVEPPAWRGVVLQTVVVLHLVLLVAAVILMKGARFRAAAIVLPGVWLTLSSGFVAGIAMAGVGP